jgi:hypothetical protein
MLDTEENRRLFSPPATAGVYMWVVGKENDLRISYVGQTSNLRKRMYEHIFYTLGGAYWLYEDSHFVNGANPEAKYAPGLEGILTQFIPYFSELSMVAYKNLTLNKIYWAILEEVEKTRILVESALIRQATIDSEPIQNERVTRLPIPSKPLLIKWPFPPGCRLHGVCEELSY